MTLLKPRILATLVDLIVSLMLTGLIISLLSFVLDRHALAIFNPTPLIWALVFVLLSLISLGRTPGKRWMKLRVTGDGCLACREARRSGWAILWGIGELAEGYFGHPNSAISGLVAMLVFAWSYDVPVLRSATDFPHNSRTGFAVQRD